MKIGELAQVTQCTVETVRYYEKEGLLPAPARTAGNFREYGPAHVERLRFIRNCRALGMSHDDERIRELMQLKDQLSGLRRRCQTEQAVDACGILHGLAAMETEMRQERHTHLG